MLTGATFSRMRSRRVPVLRLGSRGPGGDARSLRLCSPSVRKRPQAFASVGECRASSGVANRRETQNCRHFLRLAFQKCQRSQGSGGSWSRNPELSSLLDSFRLFASQKCQQSQGSGGRGREAQNCRHFWTRLGSSRLKSVNGHRDRGVVVAKRRTAVTFGLVLRLRVSKVSTVTGIGGVVVAKPRIVVTFGLASGERRGERRKER